MRLSGSLLLLSLALPRAGEDPAQEARSAPPLNVLFFLADDLGWGDLGCYGNARIATPRIDALAAQGMRFTDAYAPSPVCSPTRAALLTGKSPARLGLTQHVPENELYAPPGAPVRGAPTRDHLPLAELTIAEIARAAGMRTALVGKWHLNGPWSYADGGRGRPDLAPERQGFETNAGGCAFGGPPSFFDPYGIHNLPPRKAGEYLPERLADESIAFLRAARERPFLLFHWSYEVHWPIEAPPERVAPYLGREGPGLAHPVYAAMVSSFDAAVGRVLDELDRLGLAERTIVILGSDNGGWDEVCDLGPLRGAKGHLYEGGIRVPLIVRWPGVVAPGSTCSTPVIGTDLFATLLEALALERPGSAADTRSLLPLLRGEELEGPHPLFFHYPHYAWHGQNRPASALRLGRHKLIANHDDGSRELYDLEADPGERENLVEEQPELAAELEAELSHWLERTRALLPRRRSEVR